MNQPSSLPNPESLPTLRQLWIRLIWLCVLSIFSFTVFSQLPKPFNVILMSIWFVLVIISGVSISLLIAYHSFAKKKKTGEVMKPIASFFASWNDGSAHGLTTGSIIGYWNGHPIFDRVRWHDQDYAYHGLSQDQMPFALTEQEGQFPWLMVDKLLYVAPKKNNMLKPLHRV